MEHQKDKQLMILVTVSALVLLIAAFVTAIIITGHVTANSMPFISGILGLAGVLVPAIAATLRSSQAREATREIDRKVNGHLARLTDAAISAGVKPEDLPPLPPDITTPMEDM